MLLLQNVFCNNNELIESLSKDNDFKKLCKSSLGISLIKYKYNLSLKLNAPILEDEKKAEEIFLNNSRIILNKVLTKFPEIIKLNQDEKINVFREAQSMAGILTYYEQASCFGGWLTNINNCLANFTTNQKSAFKICMTLSSWLDVAAAIASEGAFTALLPEAIETEIEFCHAVAFGIAVNICVLGEVSEVVSCILLEQKD